MGIEGTQPWDTLHHSDSSPRFWNPSASPQLLLLRGENAWDQSKYYLFYCKSCCWGVREFLKIIINSRLSLVWYKRNAANWNLVLQSHPTDKASSCQGQLKEYFPIQGPSPHPQLDTTALLPTPQWQRELKTYSQGLLPDPPPAAGAALAPQFPAPWADPDLSVPTRFKIIQSGGIF